MRNHVLMTGTLLLALLLLPRQALAAESYDNCTGFIDSVPATISTQGVWCLRKNVSTAIESGYAISITANNVTIDCNDFKIGGLGGGIGTSTYGVYASDRANTVVRRCNIRGFYYGTMLSGSGHVVEENRFDGNTYAAIWVQGDGSTVRNNEVRDTGGSAFTTGSAIGIVAYDGVDLIGNTVSGVAPSAYNGNGHAYGILSRGYAAGGSAIGNRVRGLAPEGTGLAYGIYNEGSSRMILRGNDVAGVGSPGSVGLYCEDNRATSRDNVISGFEIPVSTCFSDGDVINPN